MALLRVLLGFGSDASDHILEETAAATSSTGMVRSLLEPRPTRAARDEGRALRHGVDGLHQCHRYAQHDEGGSVGFGPRRTWRRTRWGIGLPAPVRALPCRRSCRGSRTRAAAAGGVAVQRVRRRRAPTARSIRWPPPNIKDMQECGYGPPAIGEFPSVSQRADSLRGADGASRMARRQLGECTEDVHQFSARGDSVTGLTPGTMYTFQSARDGRQSLLRERLEQLRSAT